jgi:hypothetical protein
MFPLFQPSKVTAHSILPGMTFNAKVSEKTVKHGIVLNFGDLTGYVHHHHLDKVSIWTNLQFGRKSFRNFLYR